METLLVLWSIPRRRIIKRRPMPYRMKGVA